MLVGEQLGKSASRNLPSVADQSSLISQHNIQAPGRRKTFPQLWWLTPNFVWLLLSFINEQIEAWIFNILAEQEWKNAFDFN